MSGGSSATSRTNSSNHCSRPAGEKNSSAVACCAVAFQKVCRTPRAHHHHPTPRHLHGFVAHLGTEPALEHVDESVLVRVCVCVQWTSQRACFKWLFRERKELVGVLARKQHPNLRVAEVERESLVWQDNIGVRSKRHAARVLLDASALDPQQAHRVGAQYPVATGAILRRGRDDGRLTPAASWGDQMLSDLWPYLSWFPGRDDGVRDVRQLA